MTDQYEKFLKTKHIFAVNHGIDPYPTNKAMFDFQSDVVRWALKRGRAAAFLDCGMGKTLIELEWARQIAQWTILPVLIFAPLAVAEQTVREGVKFGIPVTLCETQDDIQPGVNITNYEKLKHFMALGLGGIVLDESSILKSLDGKTRAAITEFAKSIPYRLCASATPAPNDHTELGNHAEFLGVMTMTEMLATFFVHDGGDTSKWRLKGHAQDAFWAWVASWAVVLRKPSDLGYSDDKFILPPIHFHEHVVKVENKSTETLFPMEAKTLQERLGARRDSIAERVAACADVINATDYQWLVWCALNNESKALAGEIDGAVEITGSDSNNHKRDTIIDFISGKVSRVVSKGSICGFGLNLQNCSHVALVGLSDSWEMFYQMIRRCWRFGQTQPVHVHIFIAETEGAVLNNIKRKEADAAIMADGMLEHMRDLSRREIHLCESVTQSEYKTDTAGGEGWDVVLGDVVPAMRLIPDNSFHYSIFSPPFASLYTYSASERDMGNCRTHEEFFEHMKFLVPEQFRTLKPGRLLSFHCMNLPLSKQNDGVIGLRDFRGRLIAAYEAAGFIYHSEVVIWKDPVTAMQRTKALGLLHKQVVKDSCMSRQGIPDYLITMRKPGVNAEPVAGKFDRYVGDDGTGPGPSDETRFSIETWQRYASPVWMDINPSDTLQRESAREDKDERHICPLQLQVIERGIELWTNPGDLVCDPFGGIGSTGVVAIRNGRRAFMCELKASYFKQMVANLRQAEKASVQPDLFSLIDEPETLEAIV
jgi:hypothetical protein